MKAVQLAFNSILPEDLRDYNRNLDKKDINRLLREVSIKYPDQYADIVEKIQSMGLNASYIQGETLTIDDYLPTFDREPIFEKMDAEIDALEKRNLKPDRERDERLKIYVKYSTILDDLNKENSRKTNSGLYRTVASGARGNFTQHRGMTTTPAIYTDYKDDPIPLFVRRSFSEGLKPHEFLASTFGVRKSFAAAKRATAEAGDEGKQIANSMLRYTISDDKDRSGNFLDLEAGDPSLFGRVLARETAGYPEGTLIDREVLAHIRNATKETDIVPVYSTLTTVSARGVPAESFGMGVDGTLPHIGWHAGANVGTVMAEPLAQGALSTKHTSGAFSGAKKEISGFDYIDQFLQSPETFPDRAAVSESDGVVEDIIDAPQGGKYIVVNGKKHYVLPEFEPTVKKGDSVESGDILSEGLADPEDIVRYRGLGEGRRYYANRLKQLLADSGVDTDLRNTELLARAHLDTVRITDPDGLGDFLPDDIVSYNELEANYKPSQDARSVNLKNIRNDDLANSYLEKPVLHYTIGTQLKPSMIERIRRAGFNDVTVSNTPPPFEPVMFRLRESANKRDHDWLARFGSSYIKANLTESAARGFDTNIHSNTHPYPRLAYGKGFGDTTDKDGTF